MAYYRNSDNRPQLKRSADCSRDELEGRRDLAEMTMKAIVTRADTLPEGEQKAELRIYYENYKSKYNYFVRKVGPRVEKAAA